MIPHIRDILASNLTATHNIISWPYWSLVSYFIINLLRLLILYVLPDFYSIKQFSLYLIPSSFIP